MSNKSIYITLVCFLITLFGYGQLTIEGAELTLVDAVELSSTESITVNSTALDTSKVDVGSNCEFRTSMAIENDGQIINQGFIYVDDYLTTSDTAEFLNQSEIVITGDFDSEKGTYRGVGVSSVLFTGGSDHFVRSVDSNKFRLLELGGGDVQMQSDFTAEQIQFNTDKIVTNDNRILVLGAINGFDATSFVDGKIGRVVKPSVSSGNFIMPVGFNTTYRPARIIGVSDSTVVYMEVDSRTDDLDEFGDLTEVDESLVWEYSSDTATYNDLPTPFRIGVVYNAGDVPNISTDITTHRVSISDTAETGYNNFGGVTGDVIVPGFNRLYSMAGVPASGLLSIGQICSLNEFTVSAWLEGPFDGAAGNMVVNLNSLLKTEYEFGGTNPLQMRSGFSVPTNAVDVISVVLRDLTSLNRIDTAYAWLMDDGSTKDFETGIKPNVGFCDVSSSEFYLQVEHRNHLPIMSSNAFKKITTVTPVNLKNPTNVYGIGFTTGFNNVTMNNEVLMYAGDNAKSAANIVNAIDYFPVVNDMFSLPNGYLLTDLNLSGNVESGDNDLGLDNSSWLRKATVR